MSEPTSKTVEAVGWLLVDENGNFDLVGFCGIDQATAESCLRDSLASFRTANMEAGAKLGVPDDSCIAEVWL